MVLRVAVVIVAVVIVAVVIVGGREFKPLSR